MSTVTCTWLVTTQRMLWTLYSVPLGWFNVGIFTHLTKIPWLISTLCLKSETGYFKITVRTQQCINISTLLWQHVSVLVDHLQASIQGYEVQSVHIMYYGIPYYLQGVYKNNLKLKDFIYIKSGSKYILVLNWWGWNTYIYIYIYI